MNKISDDEIVYTPVLYLDTLKVSTIEKSAESAFATGGLKNKQLIKWNFGKNLKMTLEDALFSPASMSLIWGGKLNSKLSVLTSLVSKINIANTYGRLRYSSKAYPSPALTDEELLVLYKILWEKPAINGGSQGYPLNYDGDNYYTDFDWDIVPTPGYEDRFEDFKTAFLDRYMNRPTIFTFGGHPTEPIGWDGITEYRYTSSYDFEVFGSLYYDAPYANISGGVIEGMENNTEKIDPSSGMVKHGQEGFYFAKAVPEYVVVKIREIISQLDDLGNVQTNINNVQTVDRMEKCIVTEKNGLIINGKKQLDNLFRYYANDYNSSYTIYYDAKTMLPLVHVEDNKIKNDGDFKLKLGTVYYKWTRTVKYDEYNEDTLGQSFVIDANTFPDDYKIVGETYIRNQKTGKDQRYQIIIYKANVSSDTSITLQADGDPTTFSMTVDLLAPENDILMELIQLDVEEDKIEGGTRIKPQKKRYSYTPSQLVGEAVIPPIDNLEIY